MKSRDALLARGVARSEIQGSAYAARAMCALATCLCAACPATDTSVGAWEGPRDARTPSDDAGVVPDAQASEAAVPMPLAFYLEAESAALSGGFTVGSDPAASASRILEPPQAEHADTAPGMARARYEFALAQAGEYVIWGRIHAPGAANNRFWVQLDDGDFFKWRISTGDVWYWDDLHNDADYGHHLTFMLAAGPHVLTIANCVPGVALDRLYLTALGDVPPGNDTPCSPPHSIQLNGECVASCGGLAGQTCGAQACAGRPALPAYDCDICCTLP
ncbi:MAG: hypothetical protein QM778_38580 [Myxococcales bacterium]